MGVSTKIYSFKDVAHHNQHKNCWLIISGKVYDVTSFMGDHPGGDDLLLSSTGKDATNDYEDAGHTDSANKMLEKYYIGEIDASTIPVKLPVEIQKPDLTKVPYFSITILRLLVPLILGFAIAVRYFSKKE